MKITPEQFNKLATKDDVREIVEEKVSKFKDDILTGQDKIIGELKTIREEQAAFTGGQRRQDENLEEHDKHLEQIETKVVLNQPYPTDFLVMNSLQKAKGRGKAKWQRKKSLNFLLTSGNKFFIIRYYTTWCLSNSILGGRSISDRPFVFLTILL